MSQDIESLEVTTGDGHAVDLAPLIKRARALQATRRQSQPQSRPDPMMRTDNPNTLGAMVLGMRVSVEELFGEDARAMFDERIGIDPAGSL